MISGFHIVGRHSQMYVNVVVVVVGNDSEVDKRRGANQGGDLSHVIFGAILITRRV
jgi:hypothetical protein